VILVGMVTLAGKATLVGIKRMKKLTLILLLCGTVLSA